MADQSEAIAKLSQEKRAALLKRLVEERAGATRQRAVTRRTTPGPWPLSFGQELMWLLDQISPGNHAYNTPGARRARGQLDLGALRKALNAIVARHEVLRTTYTAVNGQPAQVVHSDRAVELQSRDVSHLPEAEREPAGRRILAEEAQRPFDLSCDVMLRVTHVRLAPDDHLLLFAQHHIASDGWSKEVLYRELAALYEAFVAGKPSPLPELPIQFADFAVWQRRWMAGERLEKLLNYWKGRLAGAPALLELPTDHPRPALRTNRGTHKRFTVAGAVRDAVKALCQKEGVTPYMLLLAAFQTLLYRYTGQEDVLVGSPIAARSQSELETLIGYFSNTLVLRTSLGGNPTFRQLLRSVRETTLSAYDHQELPFEKLVMELRPERSLSYNPLVQVAFILHNRAIGQAFELAGLTLTLLEVDRGSAKFDLTLAMLETDEGYWASCEYSTDLFEEATVVRFQSYFRTLLEAAVGDPDRHVNDLPLLPEAERHQVLVDWNRTAADYPLDRCVHQLFQEQAGRTPDAVAAVFRDQKLTYRGLDERSNRLARHLQKLGVGPNVMVGIAVESSLETAVGLLGILKAGGAYLPLDPAYPEDRLAYTLEDARAPVVLTQQRLVGRLPRHNARIVCLDADWATISQEPNTPPTTGVTPDNLAYVIYTSGSTGKPKGVLVPHRGLVNHNVAAVRQYGIGPADRVLQFCSLGFDIAVEEMFPAWISGAAVVFRPADLPVSGEAFLGWLGREGITVLDLPTAFWHEWVRELAAHGWELPACLRLVIVGGEKASADVYRTWRKTVGGRVRWVNTYGPTEITVVATTHEPDGRAEVCELPIGRPIANTDVYVLDARLRPVPIGVAGELYVGGPGVVRGYLNRPELTAEKFVPHPFSPTPGARLYRTGDRVRYLPDGQIEFLGRQDHQVKIRGFRVELGEVEAALRLFPGVREAVVVAREDRPGNKRLFGYVVAQLGQAVAADLCRQANAVLPQYMTLAAVRVLDALPLTPSGKVDRRALPDPGDVGIVEGDGFVAPRTPVEEALANIWQLLLGVDRVSVHDNFFALGGHSLMATQVVSRVREELQVEMDLRELFGAPTVAELAEVIFRKLAEEAPAEELNGSAGGHNGVHAQADGWDGAAW
jgi:amino acid adenylation domain-containing protein